jgi:hypothetical protein
MIDKHDTSRTSTIYRLKIQYVFFGCTISLSLYWGIMHNFR